MSTFKMGDKVDLKAGGRPDGRGMTVEFVDGELVECIYFNSGGDLCREKFTAATLEKLHE